MKELVSLEGPMTVAMVGGKFARQNRMARAGFPIPVFFCLTGGYFEEVLLDKLHQVESILGTIDFDDGKSVRRASEAIRFLFAEIRLKAAWEKAIFARFDKMFSKDRLVSVRASIIGNRPEEGEDSPENPFAGLSETFLYVKRDQVLDKIKLCWASGFSQEALLYRHRQGLHPLGFSVAVGIQEMVFGERSFVLFTCDPNRATRDTVIVAGYGIGEGVVQERVPVDHYFRNYRTGEITRRLGKKTAQLTFDARKGYGLAEKVVPERYQDEPCLTNDEITNLTRVGREIERLFKSPQDIEGTFAADGTFYLLQTRPVALDYRRQRVWTNANITESYPGVTTVLTYSFARFFYRVIFYDGYRQMGLRGKELHDNTDKLERMIGFLRGRIYYSLSACYHLHSLNPLFPFFRGYWERMMGFPSSYQTESPGLVEKVKGKVTFILNVIRAVFIILVRYKTHPKGIEKFHRWWEQLIAPLRGKSFDQEDLLVLVDEFHRVWRQVGNHWGITLTNDTFLPVAYGLTESLFKRWGLDEDPALLSGLLCGDEPLLSVEIILSALHLAEQVRSDPSLREMFEKESAKDLWKQIEEEEIGASFCRAVKKHLLLYGDRGLNELKMEQPNLRHEPWVFLKVIQEYARSELTVHGFQNKEHEARADAEDRLRRRLKGHLLRRAILHVLLPAVRGLIRNRENSRYCRSELFGFSKNVFRCIGRRFAAQGLLESTGDIVHLSMDEIFGYIDGTGVTEDMRKVAHIRKTEYQANQKVETPIQLTTLGPVRENVLEISETRTDGRRVLKGLGSSPGKVTGTARIVRDPTAAPLSTEDMILVARETDPGWLFMMLASRGLVVERGSMLSHTAITGRKFGIPTVVGIPHATSVIPDGARVEMDGASGRVTILSES